jgi:RNA polymerase sigma factor (TIGR02999 family)
MNTPDSDTSLPVTEWLHAWRQGNLEARDRLIEALLPRLRTIARGVLLRHPQAGALLSPTVLVNETYLRLALQPDRSLNDREHLYRLARTMMHGAVVDQLRRIELADALISAAEHDASAAGRTAEDQGLDFRQALQRLATEHPRQAEVLTLSLHGELTQEQLAEHLGMTFITLRRDLKYAVAWMRHALEQPDALPVPPPAD